MREIVSPLDGFASPFGRRRGASVAPSAPSITAFSVGPQDGTALPVSVTLIEGASPPTALYLVGVTAGSSAPSAAQVVAGQDSTGSAAAVSATIADAQTGTETASVEPPESGDYDFYAVAVDDDGRTSNRASALGVAYDAGANIAFESVYGPIYGGTLGETSRSFTVDLSGYAAGDLMLICVEVGGSPVSGVTVGGNAATVLRSESQASRISALCAYALVAAGAANTTITISSASSSDIRGLSTVVMARQAQVVASAANGVNRTFDLPPSGFEDLNVNVTAPAGANGVLAFASQARSGTTMTLETPAPNLIGLNGNTRNAIGWATDVPAGTYTATAELGSGTANRIVGQIYAVAVEPRA